MKIVLMPPRKMLSPSCSGIMSVRDRSVTAMALSRWAARNLLDSDFSLYSELAFCIRLKTSVHV